MVVKMTKTEQLISISELFGPTIQGEGASVGRPALFIRLGLCNLDCSWCDTPYTWDWTGKNGVRYDKKTELKRMPVSDVVQWVKEHQSTGRVVITGGEPLVQGKAVAHLVQGILDLGISAIEMETNGTQMPPAEIVDVVQWNVSPKLSGSGVVPEVAIVPEVLSMFTSIPQSNLKFVVGSVEEVNEIENLIVSLSLPRDRVYLMPEGKLPSEINSKFQFVIESALQLGVNVTTRLHVLAYGDMRGV